MGSNHSFNNQQNSTLQPQIGSAYDIVLKYQADLSVIPFDSAYCYFSLLSHKLYDICEAMWVPDKFTAYGYVKNIPTELNSLYSSMWQVCTEFSNRTDFQEKNIKNLFIFPQLFGDVVAMQKIWSLYKEEISTALQVMKQQNPEQYLIPFDIRYTFERVDALLGTKVVYWVTYQPNGDIVMNDKHILSRPQIEGENDQFFSYVIKHPRQKITASTFKHVKHRITKSYIKIVYELGFRKELAKIFFPVVTETSVLFRNSITEMELKTIEFDPSKIDAVSTTLQTLSKVEFKSF